MAAKVVSSCSKIVYLSRHISSKWPFIPSSFGVFSRRNRLSSSFSHNFSDAIARIKESLAAKPTDVASKTALTARLFVGTGQFYEHESNERVVILSLGDDENLRPPVMLLDTKIKRVEVDKLEQTIASLPSVGSIYSGELDSTQEGPWKFGYACKPPFSIFSASGFCCQIRHSSLEGAHFRIFGESLYEDIPVSNIKHVQVSLSPEPWEERKLQLKMKNGDVVSVVEDCEESVPSDMASLMLSTQWMVKSAGHLCITARLFGGANVSLKLPSVLRADANPWVAMRNRLWAERINDNN